MPIYEYQCKACDHEFEREQRISEKPAKKCPECGKMQAKRLISRTSFVLKGGGWYDDLYATPGAKKDGDDKGAGDSKSKSESDSKSESKDEGAKKPSKSGGKSKGKGKQAAA